MITQIRENGGVLSDCIILYYSNNTAYNEDNLPQCVLNFHPPQFSPVSLDLSKKLLAKLLQ